MNFMMFKVGRLLKSQYPGQFDEESGQIRLRLEIQLGQPMVIQLSTDFVQKNPGFQNREAMPPAKQ